MNIEPLWKKVLVSVDTAEARAAGSLIEKPFDVVEREQMTETKGTIVSVGAACFDAWEGYKPQAGDRVIFARFSGHYMDEDDKVLRLMNDDDVVALIGQEAGNE